MAKRLPTFEGSESTDSSPTSSLNPVASAPRDGKPKCTLDTLSPDGAEETDSSLGSTDDKREGEQLECAICLQPCIHPVQLPCSHIFCFLCVKGVAIQSKRCALCRQDIPLDFFNNPALLRRGDLYKESAYEGCYQWYYQGMNGWWQYDERASCDIEEHFKLGDKYLEILIAGFLYVIDYENMLQFRRNDPSRRRKIKRDLVTIPDKKGVAGLKVEVSRQEPESPQRPQGDGGENVPCIVQRGSSTTTATSSRTASNTAVVANTKQPASSHGATVSGSTNRRGNPTRHRKLPTAGPSHTSSRGVEREALASSSAGLDIDSLGTPSREDALPPRESVDSVMAQATPHPPHNTPEGAGHSQVPTDLTLPTGTSDMQEREFTTRLAGLQLDDTPSQAPSQSQRVTRLSRRRHRDPETGPSQS